MLTPFHFPALISFAIVCFFDISALGVSDDDIDEELGLVSRIGASASKELPEFFSSLIRFAYFVTCDQLEEHTGQDRKSTQAKSWKPQRKRSKPSEI